MPDTKQKPEIFIKDEKDEEVEKLKNLLKKQREDAEREKERIRLDIEQLKRDMQARSSP